MIIRYKVHKVERENSAASAFLKESGVWFAVGWLGEGRSVC